jgi:hypothetical protein
MTRANWIIIGLLGVIFTLVVILIVRKPATIVEPFDDSALREEIRLKDSVALYWELEAGLWHDFADSTLVLADSLENSKPTIKKFYHEKYKFNSTATTVQLDSVIRTNW